MNPLLDALTVRLVLAARHWLRVAGVAFFVLVWIGLCGGHTGDWLGVLQGVAFGLLFGVLFGFGEGIGSAREG